MQLFAVVSDAAGELEFHKRMDVLGERVDCDQAALEVVQDSFQACENVVHALLRKDADGGKHRRVRHATRDVLLHHARVKRDGAVERVRKRCVRACCSACPEFFHVCSPSYLSFAFPFFLCAGSAFWNERPPEAGASRCSVVA
ncbi:hypothetical protein SDC9_188455 [bioreactor metagenome]|uniref:Uncharacterized protein n=1 Tax=bioreactor metagenome TaxID=1076179 RepID=A0A645HPD2_9ZZZZ